jgi:hypothetical protein
MARAKRTILHYKMPRGIWEIDGRDVSRLRPDPGGLAFTAFVDDILQANAQLHGIALANLRRNLRTNMPDGGVDTAVDVALGGQDPLWGCPTVWQFKSREARDVRRGELQDEPQRDYAADLIRRGYGYRLCICDELTPQQKEALELTLLEGVRGVTQSAVTPRVLTASDLAAWANKFPSVILGHFRPQLATLAQHFTIWGSNITALTKTYVPVAGWDGIENALRAHLNFLAQPPSVVFSLKGVAGAGKTRFAYEVLKGLEGAQFLVLYSQDEHLLQLAGYLVSSDAVAILIADECPLETELRLEEMLRGHKERIRVVSIRNDARPSLFGAPEHRLAEMSDVECERVLAANFPEMGVST